MAYTFSFAAIINDLRSKVATAYAIPSGHAIPEAGNQPIAVSADKLPMAALETEAVPFEDGGQGLGAKAVVWDLTVHCWTLKATTQNTDDTAAIRDDLTALAGAIYADRHIGGVAARARITEMNWTGKGRDWPFEIASGVGVAAGYVTVVVTVAVGDT